ASDTGGSELAGYKIERCMGVNCSSFSQLALTSNRSYEDKDLFAYTYYRYRVRAYDGAGNLSTYSNQVLAQTPDDRTPPPAPTNLQAAANSGQVNLTWGASIDTGGGGPGVWYKVERCQSVGCSTFAEIATASSETYVDTAVTPNTAYAYRVRAED